MVKKKQDKQALVPELRFSEFCKDGEWAEIELGRLARRVTCKNTAKAESRVLTNSAKFGVVDQRDYFEKDIANKSNLGSYFIVDRGDYVYNPRISSFAPVGPVSKNNLRIGVMSPLYIVFRFDNGDNSFYEHYFSSTRWHQYLRRISNSGARHDRMSITNNAFMGMPIPSPESDEQQKIADCLSSLDDLIAAHSAKRDALQDHKKGLLQQLFPAEGQTTPKLRFPEFEGAGEWNATTLRKACLMKAGKFVRAADINDDPKDILFPCYGGNGLRGYTTTYTHEGKFSLIGRQGALCGNVQLATGRFHATEHAVVASPTKNVSSDWLYYALILLNLNRFATGQAQPGLSVEVLERVPIAIPSDRAEQHRIAACLSALDALISAQTEQIDALKEHKKGLMQQLFPNPELNKK